MLYKTLTPTEVKVLDAIRRLASILDRKDERISAETLSKDLDMTADYVRSVINGLPAGYVVSTSYFRPGEESKGGRPPSSYHVHPDTITLPESALIALKLAKFPQEKPERVDQTDFVKYMVRNHGLSKALVEDRIERLIKVGYIDGAFRKQGHLSPLLRITCERRYLELAAGMPKKQSGREEEAADKAPKKNEEEKQSRMKRVGRCRTGGPPGADVLQSGPRGSEITNCVIRGGQQTLDGVNWNYVLFKGVRIKYNGGPVGLKHVWVQESEVNQYLPPEELWMPSTS